MIISGGKHRRLLEEISAELNHEKWVRVSQVDGWKSGILQLEVTTPHIEILRAEWQ